MSLQFTSSLKVALLKSTIIALFLSLAALPLAAQENSGTEQPEMIYLEHSDRLVFDKQNNFDEARNADYQLLVGNVQFRHEDAWMYCDSAHYYQKSNSLFAIGNVRIEQGDSLIITGKTLFYDGNRRIAQLRNNVVMEHYKSMTLYTDFLDYDRNNNVGYYFNGGKLVDSTNVLTSVRGQYNPSTRLATFKDSVKVVQTGERSFELYTDTLRYHVQTNVASIISHSVIYSGKTTIHAFRGWYDTKKENSLLLDRSYIENSPNHMIGDSILFDKANGIGRGYNNVAMTDSSRSIRVCGNYVFSNQNSNYVFSTDRAVLQEFSGNDTLYLHADTLELSKDSIYNVAKAFHHVRYFRKDLQGLCDSLYYHERDSILDIVGVPIIWAQGNMVRGNIMKLYMKANADSTSLEPDYLYAEKNACMISQEASDTSYFNQSQGDYLKAFFRQNHIDHIEITGSTQSIYLPHDGNENITGLNRLEKGDTWIYLTDEGKLDHIKVAPSPKGVFYPLPLVTPADKRLSLFSWPEELRPKSKEDIFSRPTINKGIYEQKKTPKREDKTDSDGKHSRRRKGGATVR